jgi:endonuclease G
MLTPDGLGTGFLIGPHLLMTNNHVIGSKKVAAESWAEFNYQYQFASDGKPADTVRYALDPGTLFATDPDLDYTVVAVRPDSTKPPVESWGCFT